MGANGSSTVHGSIVVTFRVHKEGNQFVSECHELQTASCGETIDEAFQNIEDATLQYLNAIESAGERERIFKKRGIPIYSGHPEESRAVTLRTEDTVRLSILPLTGLIRAPAAALL